MPERLTIAGTSPEGFDSLAPGAVIGVRGFPGTVVSTAPNADDPDLVDLVVEVNLPDDDPVAAAVTLPSPPIGSLT